MWLKRYLLRSAVKWFFIWYLIDFFFFFFYQWAWAIAAYDYSKLSSVCLRQLQMTSKQSKLFLLRNDDNRPGNMLGFCNFLKRPPVFFLAPSRLTALISVIFKGSYFFVWPFNTTGKYFYNYPILKSFSSYWCQHLNISWLYAK